MERNNVPQDAATSRALIEDFLPREFLFDLGVYIQTCAHIELMTSTLICHIEGLARGSKNYIFRSNELRKLSTSELLKQMSKSNFFTDPNLRSEFDQLVAWMRKLSKNRHIAVHGAFYDPEKSGVIEVNYWHKSGSRNNPLFTKETNKIDRAAALELINDADRILRIVFHLQKEIAARQVTISSESSSSSSESTSS